jgi:DNA-binding transcriptional LysR family regulator
VSEPDWSLWRSFAAVVDEGSLSAAARKLGLSQPTLSRHIEALEATLGVTLFERTLQGLRANETALRLYEPVAAAKVALGEAALRAEGASGVLEGTVRITSSVVTSHYVLPPLLLGVRQAFPAIAIELVPSDSVENLLLREADIAVRMFRPTQLDLIARRIGPIAIVCCAHESYLARRGTPQHIGDLAIHDLIGFDRSDQIILAARALDYGLTRDHFRLRTDSQSEMWELLRAGLGVGFAQEGIVRDTPGMRRILPGIAVPGLEVWLTTHRELFTSHRIRAIYDALAAALVDYLRRHQAPASAD